MSESPEVPPIEPGASPANPGDGQGPDRLRAGLRETKKRGAYKCRRCGVKHGEGAPCGSAPAASPAPARPAPPVFTPENTGRLLRAPFTVAAVRTNCRIWLLTPAEEAELVATAVPCANEWVQVDPKWAALFMFAFSLSGVAISKAMDYAAWRRQMAAELEAQARAAAAARAKSQPEPVDVPGAPPATPPPVPPAVS